MTGIASLDPKIFKKKTSSSMDIIKFLSLVLGLDWPSKEHEDPSAVPALI